ncbi:hypothetical protein [Gimesia maris]|uniref:hypothetical protein n=1 Tax=Gimesia maris TaxID=122 RepID=UPI0030DAD1BF
MVGVWLLGLLLELPLPPFYHGFGRIQRRLAKKHDVKLVPKRVLLSILAGGDATLDSIHLSQIGQQKMADVVWGIVGAGYVKEELRGGLMKASDLLKQLKNDSEFQGIMKNKEQKQKAHQKILEEDEKALVKELNELGYGIASIWDFVNNKNRHKFLRSDIGDYSSAYPILVKHLYEEHLPEIREGIIRSLTEKNANSVASEALLDAFYKEKDSKMKWVVANALRTVLNRSQKRKHPEYKDVYRVKD